MIDPAPPKGTGLQPVCAEAQRRLLHPDATRTPSVTQNQVICA
jgi:hypothetical protein